MDRRPPRPSNWPVKLLAPVFRYKNRLGPRPTRSCTPPSRTDGHAAGETDDESGIFVPHRHIAAQLLLWANGICERFHKTMQDEFYSVAFRKKLYSSLEQLQADLDIWLEEYNQRRPHSGKYCFGKTPWQTFLDAKHLAHDKELDRFPVETSADQLSARSATRA
jgi:Integrase core domain